MHTNPLFEYFQGNQGAWQVYANTTNLHLRRSAVDGFTRSTYSISCYDSAVAFQKRAMQPPVTCRTGVRSY